MHDMYTYIYIHIYCVTYSKSSLYNVVLNTSLILVNTQNIQLDAELYLLLNVLSHTLDPKYILKYSYS